MIVDCPFQTGVLFSADVNQGSSVDASIYTGFESLKYESVVLLELLLKWNRLKEEKWWSLKRFGTFFQVAFSLVKSELYL